MWGVKPNERAYLAPFAVFMAFLALGEIVHSLFEGRAWWIVATPQYWIYPLQTLLCAAVLIWFWREYRWRSPTHIFETVFVAVAVFLIWIVPAEAYLRGWLRPTPSWWMNLFGFLPRNVGFDPAFFASTGPLYSLNLFLRFVRLVIVVPLVEEIFWRGFLLRYLINENFEQVPFGTFTLRSFLWVTLFFGVAHWGPDFVTALATGALFNAVAYRTKRLASCVLVHALTNLLLGIYIVCTRQWGFW